MLDLSGKKTLQLLVFIIFAFTTVKITAQSAGQTISPNTFSIADRKKNIRQGETNENRELRLQAIERYKKEILASPDNSVLYNNLGTTYAQLGNNEEAIAAVRKAIEINPNLANPYYNLSVIYDRLERFPEALEKVQKAISLDKTNANFRTQMCQILVMMEKYKEAVPCYETLFQLRKPDIRIRTNYGITLMWAEQPDKAFGVLEQNVQLFPQESITHNALGMALFQRKKYKQAIESFFRALELDSKFDPARYNLALAQLMNKDRDSALKQYAFLKNSNSDFAAPLFKYLFGGNVIQANK